MKKIKMFGSLFLVATLLSSSFALTAQAALSGTLSEEDFGVVNYDVGGGLGVLKGYTAGFGVDNNTFSGATSVVVKLYSGNSESSLLQTNTAILSKFNADITGTQFSTPFDVSGSFNYALDGYWTNVRASQYGQSVPAERVVATVSLANGKVITATNTNPTGEASDIYPVGTNTITASAGAHGTISPSGAVLVDDDADQTFTITPNSGYHVKDVRVDGSSVGAVTTYKFNDVDSNHTIRATFTLNNSTSGTQDDKNACKKGGWRNFINPTFKNQGKCVSYSNHKHHDKHDKKDHKNNGKHDDRED